MTPAKERAIEIAEFLVDSGQVMVLPMWKTRREAIDFLAQQIFKFMERHQQDEFQKIYWTPEALKANK